MLRIKKLAAVVISVTAVSVIGINASALAPSERTLFYDDLSVTTEAAVNLYYTDTEEIRFNTDHSNACFVEYLVTKGQPVKEGDPIAIIKSNADEAGIRETELRLKRAGEDLSDVETEREERIRAAKEYLDKMYEWNAEGLIKAAELKLESVTMDYDRRVAKQKKYIREISDDLNAMYQARDTETINAPADGEIGSLEVFKRDDILNDGQYLGFIYKTDKVLYTMADSGNNLWYGMKLKLDDYHGNIYEGTVVSSKSPTQSSEVTGDTAYIMVKDLPDNPPLRFGATYENVSYKNMIILQAEDCHKDDKGMYVLEVTDSGNIRRYFTPARTVKGKIVVLDGLEEGMKIIAN